MKIFTQDDGLNYLGTVFKRVATHYNVNSDKIKSLYGNPMVVGGVKVWSLLTADGEKFKLILNVSNVLNIWHNSKNSVLISKNFQPEHINKSDGRKIIVVRVKSDSKTGDYPVTKYESGRYSCGCPDFKNRAYHECKHIKRVKEKADALFGVR